MDRPVFKVVIFSECVVLISGIGMAPPSGMGGSETSEYSKQTENWPFNVEIRRRFLFPGDDPDIGQISEERLLFLFDFALTNKQKAVLEDRYKDGLSAIETAEKEHISRGRVYALDRIIFKKLDLHKGRLLFDENGISAGTKISDVVTSTRICRALQRSGIDTIGDLYALKEDDLLKVRNLGEKGAADFLGHLEDLGIVF